MPGTMHPNQIPTSAALVRRLLHSQYPQLAHVPIANQPLGGTDNAIYRVGEHHCVRLPIIGWAVGKQERNRELMPWLAHELSIDIPVPLYFGTPDFEYPYPWTIHHWITGTPYQFGISNLQTVEDIAQFLHDLQSLPIKGAPTAGRAAHDMDTEVRHSLKDLADDDELQELLAVWNELMTVPRWDGLNTVWLHADLAPGNLLQRDGRLAAVIDWSEPGVGDPANDLIIAWNMFTPESRIAFRQIMQVDDNTWQRAQARAFAQAALALPYYRDTYPALADQAQYTFNQIRMDWAAR